MEQRTEYTVEYRTDDDPQSTEEDGPWYSLYKNQTLEQARRNFEEEEKYSPSIIHWRIVSQLVTRGNKIRVTNLK